MDKIFRAKWICSTIGVQDVCPVFKKDIVVEKKITNAQLKITSLGVYEV